MLTGNWTLHSRLPCAHPVAARYVGPGVSCDSSSLLPYSAWHQRTPNHERSHWCGSGWGLSSWQTSLEEVGFELGLMEGFRGSQKEERGLPGMSQLGGGGHLAVCSTVCPWSSCLPLPHPHPPVPPLSPGAMTQLARRDHTGRNCPMATQPLPFPHHLSSGCLRLTPGTGDRAQGPQAGDRDPRVCKSSLTTIPHLQRTQMRGNGPRLQPERF